MIIIPPQDSINKLISAYDTLTPGNNSLPVLRKSLKKIYGKVALTDYSLTDTTQICKRNTIADVTFYDHNNFITEIKIPGANTFLFELIEKNNIRQAEHKAILVRTLRSGNDIPLKPYHYDWVIPILLITAFLYSFLRTQPGFTKPVLRFFLLRGINDPVSRDTGGIFHWQSTILNLISFLIISLFGYDIAIFYNLIPSGIGGIVIWLISLGILISVSTLRHAFCSLTGNLSGEKEVFREYLVGIYQSYHLSALFLFILIVFISYTMILPVKVFFITGIIILALIYLFLVIRLLIIFINRKISIFYLILYLCALEILPVCILIRYISSLV